MKKKTPILGRAKNGHNIFPKSHGRIIWQNETSREVGNLEAFKNRIDCHLSGVAVIGMD